jgi:hypothetical protein
MTTPAAPIRAEVKFFGGTGHREQFTTWDELAAWLQSPGFSGTSGRIRTLTVVAPHVKYPADPDRGQPRQRNPIPKWMIADLPPSMRPDAG